MLDGVPPVPDTEMDAVPPKHNIGVVTVAVATNNGGGVFVPLSVNWQPLESVIIQLNAPTGILLTTGVVIPLDHRKV